MLNFIFKPWPKHPIDRQYGIETSSRVMRRNLRVGDAVIDKANVGYVGSHPSVFRRAVEALPKIDEDTHFFDLGCGKGRVLALASEYPFGSITGVELFPKLSRVARRNAERIARLHPERTRISIVQGDATRPPLPDRGNLILFLYNPFRLPLVERLLVFVEAHGAANPQARTLLFYYNPTQAAFIDRRPVWSRYFADQIVLSDEDLRYAPFDNRSESVAIWQLAGADPLTALPGAEREIRTIIPDLAVEVAI